MMKLKVGEAYYIRTMTFHYTGRVVEVTAFEVVLEDAAWIPDQGRMYDALKTGESKVNEIEPFPDGVILNCTHITDAAPWKHPLPSKQK